MKFEDLPEHSQEELAVIASYFHYRTGAWHEDGSMGDVKITIHQLYEALTQAYTAGSKASGKETA